MLKSKPRNFQKGGLVGDGFQQKPNQNKRHTLPVQFVAPLDVKNEAQILQLWDDRINNRYRGRKINEKKPSKTLLINEAYLLFQVLMVKKSQHSCCI